MNVNEDQIEVDHAEEQVPAESSVDTDHDTDPDIERLAQELGMSDDTPSKAKPQAVESKQQQGSSDAPSFDVNGKLKLAAGQQLTADHIKELQRGFLRESDYTRKTQELSKIREEAQGVLQAVEEIRTDPRAIRKHFQAEQLLSAFHPKELVNWVMPRIGVSPQAWQEFCKWQEENGASMPSTASAAYNPQDQALAPLINRLNQLEGKLTGYEQQSSTAAQQQAMNNLAEEVKAACDKYPNVKRDDVLLAIQRDEIGKPVEELARELNADWEERWQNYIKTKTRKQGGAVRMSSGSSHTKGLGTKRATTFDEATEFSEQLLIG